MQPRTIISLLLLLLGVGIFTFLRLNSAASQIEILVDASHAKFISISELIREVPHHQRAVNDPHELNRELGFEVFPAEALLKYSYGNHLETYQAIEFICSDGYRSLVTRSDLASGDAYFAFGRSDRQDFTLNNHLADAAHPRIIELGPLYLIWDTKRRSEPGSIASLARPFQIVSINLLSSIPGQANIPTPAKDDSAEVKRGYALFRARCMSCHYALSPEEQRNEIPSMHALAQAVEKNGYTWFHTWVAKPQAIKPDAKMPPVALAIPELNDIIRYLKTLSAS